MGGDFFADALKLGENLFGFLFRRVKGSNLLGELVDIQGPRLLSPSWS
jgi:hypothetical protein